MRHVMTSNQLQKVRSYLAALRSTLSKRFAGRADEEALLEFRRLCWGALLLVDDPECQQHIDSLVQDAKVLFRGEAPESMKRRLEATIGACSTRLDAVEAGYGKRWRDLRAA